MLTLTTPELTSTEAEFIVSGKTTPRVTRQQILDEIQEAAFEVAGGRTTICIATMRNGWRLVGQSSAASAETFDAEVGRAFAFEDCVRQAWVPLGYVLREQLHQVEQAAAPASAPPPVASYEKARLGLLTARSLAANDRRYAGQVETLDRGLSALQSIIDEENDA